MVLAASWCGLTSRPVPPGRGAVDDEDQTSLFRFYCYRFITWKWSNGEGKNSSHCGRPWDFTLFKGDDGKLFLTVYYSPRSSIDLAATFELNLFERNKVYASSNDSGLLAEEVRSRIDHYSNRCMAEPII